MSDNKIIIQNLNKSYGKKQVLFDVNLEIERGMFGLLGGKDNADENTCHASE